MNISGGPQPGPGNPWLDPKFLHSRTSVRVCSEACVPLEVEPLYQRENATDPHYGIHFEWVLTKEDFEQFYVHGARDYVGEPLSWTLLAGELREAIPSEMIEDIESKLGVC